MNYYLFYCSLYRKRHRIHITVIDSGRRAYALPPMPLPPFMPPMPLPPPMPPMPLPPMLSLPFPFPPAGNFGGNPRTPNVSRFRV